MEGGALHLSDHPATHYSNSGKVEFEYWVLSWVFSFFLLLKQLRFTITHSECHLCWHTWNYCTGSQPPKMTENRKIGVGCVKGDTLVTRLRCSTLAFEWTECQPRSPSVVTLNKNISSHSLHIKCTKSIWHLARTLWVLKCAWACGVNTYIYPFYVFNDVRVHLCVCVCVSMMGRSDSLRINHTENLGSHSHCFLTAHMKLTVYCVYVNRPEIGHAVIIKPRKKGM